MEPKKSLKTGFYCKSTLLTSHTTPTNNNCVIEAMEVNEPKTVYRLQISDLV